MENKEFKPYVPADKVTPEFTATSIIIGVLLAIIFGAANAYLGLRVGMTVSASIPAAVISMGVIRVIMKKDSILESNMVQTIGSAGESLAAGAIFTLPALFLWANEGKTEAPNLLTISLIALVGGVLGVLFMIPLRNALIVKEHGVLPYPEGTACAEVLLAGEEGGTSAKTVFAGMGLSAVFKFITDGLKVVPGVVTAPIRSLRTAFSAEVYPALLGVGYICGIKIASYMFAGALLGWFVLIPAITIFGGPTTMYPGDVPIAQMYAEGGADAIWGSYIRYIGAGAVAAGGIISLIKSLPLIVSTFKDSLKGLKGGTKAGSLRTEQDLDMRLVLGGSLVLILVIWLLPAIPVSLIGALLVVVFGFFFATVSSRMVGLVGSSNNPVSGMAIATLLFSGFESHRKYRRKRNDRRDSHWFRNLYRGCDGRRHVTGFENGLYSRGNAEKTADRRTAWCRCSGVYDRRSIAPSQQCVGLWNDRTGGSAGDIDENDHGRCYEWKSSMAARTDRYFCGNCR